MHVHTHSFGSWDIHVFIFLPYTFLNFPKFYTNHVLSFSSDETKFLFLKTPTYFEMSNVLHLDCLLLLIRSTGAHYIIFLISQLGLRDLFHELLQNPPGWSLPCPALLQPPQCCQSDPSTAQPL